MNKCYLGSSKYGVVNKMEEKIDKDPSDETTDSKKESKLDEIISKQVIVNGSPIQATNNLEGSDFAHLGRKKNWKAYFWEFLMLFLAVFCGFLAQYQLEHVIEHQQEEQFIQALHSDLNADITRLEEIVELRNERAQMLDSFSILLNGKEAFLHSNDLYYYNSFATRGVAFRFTPVDGTMQQLKAGNLRLVRNNSVKDSIVGYDVFVRAFSWGTQDEEDVMGTYRNIAEGIFDGVVLNSMRNEDNDVIRLDHNPDLRLTEESKFRLNYRIHMLTVFNKTMRKEARKLLLKAQQLNELLKKEYHL